MEYCQVNSGSTLLANVTSNVLFALPPLPPQVNPLAETAEKVVAADAKLGFDDNAAFRQKDLFAMRDESQEDPR